MYVVRVAVEEHVSTSSRGERGEKRGRTELVRCRNRLSSRQTRHQTRFTNRWESAAGWRSSRTYCSSGHCQVTGRRKKEEGRRSNAHEPHRSYARTCNVKSDARRSSTARLGSKEVALELGELGFELSQVVAVEKKKKTVSARGRRWRDGGETYDVALFFWVLDCREGRAS